MKTTVSTSDAGREAEVLSSTAAVTGFWSAAKRASWGIARRTEAVRTPARVLSVLSSSPSRARW